MSRLRVPVILAGGAGTRLWPRDEATKPFIRLPDGETLLAKTARRALNLPGVAGLLTIKQHRYCVDAMAIYEGLGEQAPRDPLFLLEPRARNTTPAIAV